MRLRPAPPHSGIVFVRRDIGAPADRIPARWDNVVDTRMCTVLGNAAGTTVATVEHLMAALSASGIDNAEIVLDGPEVPIMDGSAQPFMAMLARAGLTEQAATRRWVRVIKPVRVANGVGEAALIPSSEPAFHVEIDFDTPAIGPQQATARLDRGGFREDIAPARTFGFAEDVAALREAGLVRGGSLDNAVVIAEGHVLNTEGLRYEDEFARHKLLDAVGDMALAGSPLLAQFNSSRGGHALNNALLRALFADESAFEVIDSRSMGRVTWQHGAGTAA